VVAPQPSTGEVAPKPRAADTNVVTINKGSAQDTKKFVSKDSAKADSAKRNKPPL
jgi:hypothetical protein